MLDQLVGLSVHANAKRLIVVYNMSVGYYRVLYDSALRQLLVDQLEADSSVISQYTRSQLIDDYFTFAEHSTLSQYQS
jgi:hypothetical protein